MDIYNPELRRAPPAEDFLASYFGYKETNEEVDEEVELLPDYEA